MRTTIILLTIITFTTSTYAACTFDYECGNQPYGYCGGGADDCKATLTSLAVQGNNIYYAQICRTTVTQPNITIKRITTSGSTPVNVNTRQQIPAAVNPSKILGIAGDYLYLDIVMRQPGRGLRALNVKTNVENTITPDIFLQSDLDFDVPSNTMYACNYRPSSTYGNYTIDKYPTIATSGSLAGGQTVYTLPDHHECGPFKHSGNDLYFTSYTATTNGTYTSFFRGTTTCVGCTASAPLFFTMEQVIDMDVSTNPAAIFYGTQTGLYRLSVDGSVRTQLVTGTVTGVRVVGNKVYYNTGSSIRSINTDGSGSRLLNLNPSGTCVCRPVFTGDKCQTCNGQVQWNYNNQPDCVPTDANGVPESCYHDYNCGNPPYTVCYGTCQCRTNFYGPKCDKCDKTVTWDEYGSPQCK